MLKNLKKLNRTDLKKIQGGIGIEKCDIGPIGCPCKIPPGDPCLGGGSGGGPVNPSLGYCPDNQSYIPCEESCPSGMRPLCALIM
ncbi:hypothetical protein DRF65_06155 [Chryseobacterium pennae]|uniref:Bacteriocin n=1 Tax=Chryseobacterium pennae TaxID=2258962 RepID=A0A3D9CBX1_9FLAO|nr:hypothetical protein [Chryseobacterium pennae]REC63234.1 hypothetical protein DRF65_06155 [Chryseobacterium pennae]